ncbi:MAG: DUF2177 family protein [Bacteroidales bacterium]|nr:DUF2177 family protein [Bacteroidales bacterium]
MYIKLFLVAFFVFLVIDMIWLALIAKKFYRKHLGFLMSPKVNWTAAIIFYVIFIIGIVVFVVTPALDKDSLSHALIYGALFGFVTYATYDLTNLATLKNWPIVITIVDLIWGTVLATSVSVITFLIFS